MRRMAILLDGVLSEIVIAYMASVAEGSSIFWIDGLEIWMR